MRSSVLQKGKTVFYRIYSEEAIFDENKWERERMSVCVYVCVSEWMDKKKVERQADRRKWLLIILDSF